MATQAAYAKTPAGTIEIKTLPPAQVMAAEGTQDNYFDKQGERPFMQLFRYIQANQIPMTTPVEVAVTRNRMLFYAPPDEPDKTLPVSDTVLPGHLPERTVVSAGLRGGYSEKQYQQGLNQIEAWLAGQAEWQAGGQPYAVYWDSPYVPFFLKHAEVHQPVLPVQHQP